MAAPSNANLPSPPVFPGEDYNFWSSRMMTYLRACDLWEITIKGCTLIEGEIPDDTPVSQVKKAKEDAIKNFRALSLLHSAVSETIFPRIVGVSTAKEAWDLLKEEFQGSEKTKAIRLLHLKREFAVLSMKESEFVKDYLSRVMEIVNQIRIFGELFTDKMIVEKILISLTERFDPMIAAVEESKDITKLSVTELIGSLQAHEQRMLKRTEISDEAAFQARHKGKESMNKDSRKSNSEKSYKSKMSQSKKNKGKKPFPECGICSGTNHLEKYCWYKNKGPIICRGCKQPGHFERNYKAKQAAQQDQPQQQQQRPPLQANFADNKHHEDHLFMTAQTGCSTSRDSWLIDSACTNHMTFDSKFFTSLDKSVKSSIKIGNGEYVHATGKGTIQIQTKRGTKFIKDVLLVPDLHQNLLSVAQMMNNGYALSFKGKFCTIYDSRNTEIARIAVNNNSFPLNWSSPKDHVYVSIVDESFLWHKRFGHFNMQSLKHMQSNDMVLNMPSIVDHGEVCECCQLGKLSRQPFSSNQSSRAKEKLQLVHSDVCGPMRTPSLSHNRYFLIFIDDFTRMT